MAGSHQGDENEAPPGREFRTGRFFAAMIIRPGKAPLKAAIRNVSAHGMGGRADPAPLAGETVTISMGPLGEVTGHVRWSVGKQFGIQLDRAIDLEKFDFSGRSWAESRLPDDPQDEAERFRPATSTWRPGFRTR